MSNAWPAPTVRTDTSLSGGYWRHWAASAISNLGDGVVGVAMPLLMLTLTDDERMLALVLTMWMLPWVVLSLPFGVVVDRSDRKRLLVVSNVVRIGLFAFVAAGAAGEWLSAWQILALLLLIGTCEVAFDSAAAAFLPMIVHPAALPRANGLLASAEFVSGSLIGLAIGAYLFDIAVGLPFVVNAVTFSIAAVLTLSIRVSPRPPAPSANSEAAEVSLRAGLSWLRQNRPLRTLAVMLALTNLGLLMGQGVYAKYAVDALGLEPSGFGLLLAITAIGAAVGGLIAGRIVERVGMRAAIVLPYLFFVAGNVAVGASRAAWLTGVAAFLLGASITVWNVATITLRQQQIPSELFGRVNAVFRWVGSTAFVISTAVGGVIAHATTVRMPFIVGAMISLLTILVYGRRAMRGLDALG